jgi:hypothetical protein
MNGSLPTLPDIYSCGARVNTGTTYFYFTSGVSVAAVVSFRQKTSVEGFTVNFAPQVSAQLWLDRCASSYPAVLTAPHIFVSNKSPG